MTGRTFLDHQPSHAVRRRPGPSAARGGAAIAALALLAGCAGGTKDAPSSTPTPGVSQSSSATASPTPPAAVRVPAYFVIDTRTGLRIAREVRAVATDDPVRAAVEAMIAGPVDPDYATTWNPATTVLGVEAQAGSVVVDLSTEARTADVGSAGAALMVQQLVYTVTDAAGEPGAAVALRIDGDPAGELWGALTWDKPVTREDPLSVRLLVQIDEPLQGSRTSSPVTVTGIAAVFEATLPWRVVDASGDEVTKGVAMTSEGQTFAPYSFTVDLEPGTYSVVVTEDDPSDGAGGTLMSDSRDITVE